MEPIKINRIQSRVAGLTPQERLIQVVETVWPEDENVESIGIAVAGPLNLEKGMIQKSPNIPDFDNFLIVGFLEKHFMPTVLLGNDANLAALGEWKYVFGQGHQDLIYLTISTGIGSGVISGGGVANSIDLLLPYIETALETDVFAPGYTENLVLTTAALGDDAGL